MDKNQSNSSQGQRSQLQGGLPPTGQLGNQSGTKNKGFKSAQRSTNFQRVGNSISGNDINQSQSTHNGNSAIVVNSGLKPARFSHQVDDEYKHFDDDLQH